MGVLRLLLGTLVLRPYVFVFLAVYLCAAVTRMGWPTTAAFSAVEWAIAYAAEFSSTRSGVPFGLYVYVDATRDRELWLSNVPFFDSLSFTFLCYLGYALAIFLYAPLVCGRGDFQVADTRAIRTSWRVLVTGAFLTTLMDLVIDPLTVRGERWFLGRIYYYPAGGIHFGVPLSNYAGWFLVAAASIAVFQALERRTSWPTARTPAAALSGREVMDTAQQKNGFSTWRDRVLETTMESYATTLQRTREATVSEQTDPRGEHRTFMEFTGPADVTGTLFLHLSPRGEKDQQWVYTPSARKARRLADAARDENFMGTDLSYRDLELIVRIQQWNDSEATATLEPETQLDGKPCQVVGPVPKNKEFPYSRYRLGFGGGDFLLWKVEVYDLDGKLFKSVTMSRYERVQDFATAQESSIANVQYGTHTLFKIRNVRYNSGVPDDTFAVANVQKGH